MPLTLRVLAPDKSVFDNTVEEVILPSTTGLLGILPGHISMVTAIDIGVLKVRVNNGNWESIALMGGFAEVESDDVTVLVNSAELGKSINSSDAEKELEQAKSQLSKLSDQANSAEKIKAKENLDKARARAQAVSN
ncbi:MULTISPECIES: ATP synthase F1 subunit epsilon [unclassified Prochlorococcus]|uniref:ATP synthase F1 subunit epsilon n=1 Tax=unclassified Prochlorococcus TaxID=2627481 RepID=UPI00053378C3|nr:MULTISPECIES: ATP synthase F1 subunit epsilon [unclassified Prochlorococcus]KGG14801.1 ATP synthase epsilon chain [Prochlorococcus sp. MIT 0602]KGG15765.1 ATP synthase epsilon chain [Prochlorococcus sp. MIT 0603]